MLVRYATLALLLILFRGSTLFGQLLLGEWRTHLPYSYCNIAVATDDRIYCSATGGLFYYSLADNSVNKVSKIDGLSDNGISAMRWDHERKILIIAYENANLDVIRDGEIVNIPDILKKQIPGDKSVNDIYFKDSYAYLSTGFGIVVLNLERMEIKETYIIGDNGESLKVNQTTSDGTYLYAATEKGIRRGLLSDPFLVDFNAWMIVSNVPNASGAFECITSFNGNIFTSHRDPAGLQDAVYYSTGESWAVYPYFTGKRCYDISRNGDQLLLVDNQAVSRINSDLLVIQQLELSNPRSATLDPSGNLWVAVYGGGLITNRGGSVWSVKPNGPASSSVYDMASAGNILYAVQGGVSGSWNNLFLSAILERFSEGEWDQTISWENNDLVTLAIDPADPGHVFAGSWGYGLLEFREGKLINRYRDENSTLQSIIPGGDFFRLGGIAYDANGNLWVTNSNVERPVSVMKNDGSWKSFRADNLISEFDALGEILVTRTGNKWILVPRGNGLFAMDDNGTVDDESDDIYKKISILDRNGKIITNDVRSFAEDKNGNLWLGTNQGILVIYSPGLLFSEGSVYAQEIIVPRNDGTIYGDPLLGSQIVTAIEVDGANRKWLGTAGGGVYLVSEDGFKQIKQFNVSNSPLLSDNITDICIDGVSGEVFFGTDKGIISYKGEALTGSNFYDHVVVYPNPVRETYKGPIAIKGLVENTTVKITDIGGSLVYETQSLGGQAIWDGKNFRGERVATGVYMIYLSDKNGSLSHVTKILFIH